MVYLALPFGAGVLVGVAPGVVVEGEEVAALVVGAAVEVEGGLVAVFFHVGGRVADWDGAEASRDAVLLHVAADGFDVGGCVGGLRVVDDFVTVEVEERVRVLGEDVHGGEDGLQVGWVVGWTRVRAVDAVERGVHVEGNVDACCCQLIHANVVVGCVVDCVYTDSVDAETAEVLEIAAAYGRVCERIFGVAGSTGLVVQATDIETLVAGVESWRFYQSKGSYLALCILLLPLPRTVTVGTLALLELVWRASILAGEGAGPALARVAAMAIVPAARKPFMVDIA